MSDRDSFLRAIIATPDDDKPRLIFADWLDEHVEPERAEFIRVQCELAKTGPCEYPVYNRHPDEGPPQAACFPPYCLRCRKLGGRPKAEALRQRERDLFIANGFRQVEWMGKPVHDIAIAGRDWLHYLSWFTRGFVSHVTCTWADFSTYADAIRRATPLTDVRLTRAPQPYPGLSIRAGWFHPNVPPENSTTASSLTEELFGLLKGGRPHGNPTRVRWYDSDADAMRDLRQAMDASGIRFELPQPAITNDWNHVTTPQQLLASLAHP